MLSVLCALVLSSQAAETVVEPTDDVWVYQFAEDQTGDQFLRAWGSDDGAVGKSFEGDLTFSYSCLKFKIPMPLPNTKLKAAKLVLTHTPSPGWDPAAAEKHPLEARNLTTDWVEKDWAYEKASKVHPSADPNTVYGTGYTKPPAGDQPFKIEIDLMKGPGAFAKAFDTAIADPTGSLAIALTSALQPEGESSVYKVYSRSNDPELRPKLVLTFEPK